MKIKLTLAILSFISIPALAGGFLGDLGPGGRGSDLVDSLYTQQFNGAYQAANTVQTNLKVISSLAVRNTLGYELIGIYSGATANRDSASIHQHVTGISGVAFKNSATAHAAGLECDVFNFLAGGTATCLRVKFTLSEPGDVGIRMEPPSYATGLTGISFAENPHAYKYATDFAGAPVAMGSQSGSVYCIQFNELTSDLEYIKNCGTISEQVVGKLTITPLTTYTKASR